MAVPPRFGILIICFEQLTIIRSSHSVRRHAERAVESFRRRVSRSAASSSGSPVKRTKRGIFAGRVGSADYAGRVSNGNTIVGNRTSDNRSRTDCGSGTDIGHDGGRRSDPAVGTDGHLHKLAPLKGSVGRIAGVLMLAAENLDAGGEQRPVADDDPSEDAVAADVDAGTDTRFGVGEE